MKIVNQYWQLRATALNLFAVENKLTEEDFNLDFSADPALDIENLATMSADDARFDLGMKDRMLRRCAAKQPIDRVSRPEDKAKVENNSIKSSIVDIDPGKRSNIGEAPKAESPTGESAKAYAERIVNKLLK